MADIINLRRARKAKDRQAALEHATFKRALHGRTKAEKAHDMAEGARRDRILDNARIETGESED